MGLFKGKVCLVLLVVSFMVICMSLTQAKEEEREVSNPRRDPMNEYRECRERCQEDEEGRREQQVCESKCERERKGSDEFERERGEESGGNDNPYVFQDEHFDTLLRTQEGRIRVLPKFTERSSKLFKGIENFRVMVFESNPQTFIVPNHWDADTVFFVAQGKATITNVFKDRRESFNIEQGHLLVHPAGVTAYLINRDQNEKLVIVKLISSVSNPGKFQQFFGAGGKNPESFFNAFSTEVLEAVFKTSGDRVQRLFSQQREGMLVRASKEQIRALTHEESSIWPFGSKGSKEFSPINLLRQRPKESNEFGKLFEIDTSDNNILQDLGIAVSFANITQGSMHTPYYNSRATKIAVVVNGQGNFEMACPHVSESGDQHHHQRHHDSGRRSRRGEDETSSPIHYEKIRSELRPGTVFVVPPGHSFVTFASQNDNLEVICFEVNAENNKKFPLAGQRNIMKNFEREAKELAFATSAEEVDRVFESQDEEFFFQGPRQERHRHGGVSII